MQGGLDLKPFLSELGVKDLDGVTSALAAQGICDRSDFDDLDQNLRAELDVELRNGGVTIGDRAKIQKAFLSRGSAVAPLVEQIDLNVEFPLNDVAAMRRMVAAVGKPDEGMRGTPADVLKLRAVADPRVLASLSSHLRGRSIEATAAAAVVRSISITPSAAATMSAALAKDLCSTLARPRPVLTRALLAVCRLTQHSGTHGDLLSNGAVSLLAGHARHKASDDQRLDLLACIGLAFLSATAGPAATVHVPLSVGPELVTVLRRRMFVDGGPEQGGSDATVAARFFCGFPVDYRPRFILQALARLGEHSGAHVGTLWRSALPELLCGLLRDELPNDAQANVPYGDPDAKEIAKQCAVALLANSRGQDSDMVEALREVASSAQSNL